MKLVAPSLVLLLSAGTPAALQLAQTVQDSLAARDTGLSVNVDQLNRAEPYESRRAKQIQLRPFPTTSVRLFCSVVPATPVYSSANPSCNTKMLGLMLL